VQDASVQSVVQHEFGPATFTFNLVGPPDLVAEEVVLLARMHVQALFTLVTTIGTPEQAQLRLLPRESIAVLGFFPASDWGNPQLLEIASRASSWAPRAQIISAEGFFRALLRRSAVDAEGWFWALEWNKNIRVAGAIHLPESPSPLFKDLPILRWSRLPDGSGRVRRETPLVSEDDRLFEWDERQP
jgi:hypothetical protein